MPQVGCLNPSVSEPVKSAWDGYRRCRWLGWLFFPLWGLIFILPECLPYLILPSVVLVIFMIRVQWFPCPQCGQPFFCGGSFIFNRYKPWAESCANCGHPKWAEPIPKPPRSEPYPWPQPNARLDTAEKMHSELKAFLTLVLASDPSSICLKVDHEGWADLDHLIARSNFNGLTWTRDQIVDLLEQSVNTGFELDPTESRIRCIRN
jgi:hypothetical protein